MVSKADGIRCCNDCQVETLCEVVRNSVESVDPCGAHWTWIHLFLSKHELVEHDRSIRTGKKLAESYGLNGRVSSIEARRYFFEDVIRNGRTLRKLAAQLRHPLALIPQFDFRATQLISFGKIFVRLIPQIRLSKYTVDHFSSHGASLVIEIEISKSQYTRGRFLIGRLPNALERDASNETRTTFRIW
jgi:hypothetical protein